MNRLAISFVLVGIPGLAFAGDPTVAAPEPLVAAPVAAPAGNALSFRLGLGASYAPDYFGSDSY